MNRISNRATLVALTIMATSPASAQNVEAWDTGAALMNGCRAAVADEMRNNGDFVRARANCEAAQERISSTYAELAPLSAEDTSHRDFLLSLVYFTRALLTSDNDQMTQQGCEFARLSIAMQDGGTIFIQQEIDMLQQSRRILTSQIIPECNARFGN
ncbi:hypothetical protein [Ponticaulis sp.]|uniref:hypothetical protein n=1 Tax=Ponticaulis sp. TaxID=2020902 RepID=UPI00263A2CF1|nr:hypothetical protein [Ponticaulis sp.]MDF1680132.1 hypothetical protein [Ponticaulis sp.]